MGCYTVYSVKSYCVLKMSKNKQEI